MLKNIILFLLALLAIIIVGYAFGAVRQANGAGRVSNGSAIQYGPMPYQIPSACWQNCTRDLQPLNVMELR